MICRNRINQYHDKNCEWKPKPFKNYLSGSISKHFFVAITLFLEPQARSKNWWILNTSYGITCVLLSCDFSRPFLQLPESISPPKCTDTKLISVIIIIKKNENSNKKWSLYKKKLQNYFFPDGHVSILFPGFMIIILGDHSPLWTSVDAYPIYHHFRQYLLLFLSQWRQLKNTPEINLIRTQLGFLLKKKYLIGKLAEHFKTFLRLVK